ncbi:MAG TPA: hypothetical protein VGI16_05965 [Candidatus Acidoferrum sp.]
METELPPQDSVERFRNNSLTKSFLTFALHQFIATYGISFTAPIVFSLAFKVSYLFGHASLQRDFHVMVTRTPYFPVQIIFALIIGALLGLSVRHRSMLWVWVLPLAALCYAFFTAPHSVMETKSISLLLQLRLSHFFGGGCRPSDRCLDQLLVTLPFYSSLSYSVGALLARRATRFGHASRQLHLMLASAGSIILIAIFVDLIVSIRETGWQTTYLFVLAVPVGMGAYLLYVSSTIRREII